MFGDVTLIFSMGSSVRKCNKLRMVWKKYSLSDVILFQD